MNTFEPISNLFSLLRGDLRSQDLKEIAAFVDPDEDQTNLIRELTQRRLIKNVNEWQGYMDYWAKHRMITAELGGFPATCADFIQLLVATWKVEIFLNGDVRRDAASYNIEQFKRDVRIKCDHLRLAFLERQIADEAWAYTDYINAQQLQELRDHIAYRPDVRCEDGWKVADDCCYTQAKGFAAAVIRKFIYQVKRKMNDLPIDDHLMPIITGKQGSGKSRFIEKLVRPLEDVTYVTNVVELLDRRNIDLWKSFVVRLPEMEKATKADMAAFKGSISDPYHNARILGTSSVIKVPHKCVMIGDANESLSMLLNDATGMRRFVELQFVVVDDYSDIWARINSVNFLDLWRSIDPEGADPMTAFALELKKGQETAKVPSAVEEWLADADRDDYRVKNKVIDTDGRWIEVDFPSWEKGEFKKASDLYVENFKPWSMKMKGYAITNALFYNQMNLVYRDNACRYGLVHVKSRGVSKWVIK